MCSDPYTASSPPPSPRASDTHKGHFEPLCQFTSRKVEKVANLWCTCYFCGDHDQILQFSVERFYCHTRCSQTELALWLGLHKHLTSSGSFLISRSHMWRIWHTKYSLVARTHHVHTKAGTQLYGPLSGEEHPLFFLHALPCVRDLPRHWLSVPSPPRHACVMREF